MGGFRRLGDSSLAVVVVVVFVGATTAIGHRLQKEPSMGSPRRPWPARIPQTVRGHSCGPELRPTGNAKRNYAILGGGMQMKKSQHATRAGAVVSRMQFRFCERRGSDEVRKAARGFDAVRQSRGFDAVCQGPHARG